jgi:hypothetical protein
MTTVTATPAVTGQSVTFTATVVRGTGRPTGSVTFALTGADSSTPACDGGTNVIAVGNNPSGPGSVAQCTISAGLFAMASPYQVTASYSGDSTYHASQGTLSKIIHKGNTTTTVAGAPSPSVTGEAVVFTAAVAAASPSTGSPTGSVTFTITGGGGATASCDGGSNTVTLTSGSAQCSVSGGLLAQGSAWTASVAYSGDGNFNPGNGSATQLVGRATATITVTPSVNPVITDQPVSFTATVAVQAPGAGTPTGSVVFTIAYDDGTGNINTTSLTCQGGDTVPLSGSSATCQLPNGLPARYLNYQVSAVLSDPNFKTPIAGSVTENVSKAATATSLEGVPGGLLAAQPFGFDIGVATQAPATGSPSGLIEWAICPDPLPPSGNCIGYPGGTVVTGTPTKKQLAANDIKVYISVPGGIRPGYYSVNSTYEGDSNDQSSTAPAGHIYVITSPTSMSLSTNHNPAKSGQQTVFKASVQGSAHSTAQLGAPSGTVTFTITGHSGDTLTCASGSNTITISTNTSNQGIAKCTIAAGELMSSDSPYTVSTAYSGDNDYGTSTGGLTEHVES